VRILGGFELQAHAVGDRGLHGGRRLAHCATP
jgi:hypothetical protein